MNRLVHKLRISMVMFLVVSLAFTIPMNISTLYAADNGDSGPSMMSGQSTRGDVRDDCSITPPLDVKSSLILSIVMLCIPGILEKIQEYRQIQCRQVVCSYNAVSAGLTPTFCEKEKQYSTCKYIVGEVFAIPPMSVLNYLRDFISNIMANPIGVAWGATAKMARNYASTCISKGGCNSMVKGSAMIFLAVTDITAAMQTYRDIKENGFFPDFKTNDICEDVPDIKEELEDIVDENEKAKGVTG